MNLKSALSTNADGNQIVKSTPSPVTTATDQEVTALTAKAPLPLLALAIGMLASYLPGILPGGLGSGVAFLGWMVPLLVSAVYLLANLQRVRLPVLLWVPWALWAILYLLLAEAANALQRTVMMLTPLVVGAAFSAMQGNDAIFAKCRQWLMIFFWVFLGAAAMATGLAVGQLYNLTGFAAGSITASLLAAWFAVLYTTGRQKKYLICWALLAIVPVLANTRTGMVAVALTLPLVLTPYAFYKRILIIGLMIFVGIGLFYTERIQQKMFYSGEGTLQEAFENTLNIFAGEGKVDFNFASSGRYWLNKILIAKLDEAYWLGHGANTTEAVSFSITQVTHPHNDWLRLRYEYGMIGMVLFGLAMLLQTGHAWLRARRLPVGQAVFLYAGATAFIPMAIFMLSDNVIMYSAWFGNLHFALLGLGYAFYHRASTGGVPRF